MTYYFFHDGSAQHGPYTADQIQQKNLSEKTPVWYSGLKDWTIIAKVPELRPKNTQENSQTISTNKYDQFIRKYQVQLTAFGVLSIVVSIISITGVINSRNAHDQTVKFVRSNTAVQNVAALPVEEKQRIYRNNWEQYIKLTNNEPVVKGNSLAAFDVYITNDTEYSINEVELIAHYMIGNRIVQTRIIPLNNILPKSVARTTAPQSANAQSVKVSVRRITSTEMSFWYPRNNGNGSDPYFFK